MDRLSKTPAPGAAGQELAVSAIFIDGADDLQASESFSRFVAYSSHYLFWLTIVCLGGVLAML